MRHEFGYFLRWQRRRWLQADPRTFMELLDDKINEAHARTVSDLITPLFSEHATNSRGLPYDRSDLKR